MTYIAKKCIGCQSNKRHYGVTYSDCKTHIGVYSDFKLHRIFRDQFCPCVECLVKATCTEPKISMFRYMLTSEDNNNHHKCNLLLKQIDKFSKYIKRKNK